MRSNALGFMLAWRLFLVGAADQAVAVFSHRDAVVASLPSSGRRVPAPAGGVVRCLKRRYETRALTADGLAT
jgi:hypothetical protein